MKGGFGDLMKQAQEMQEKVQRIQQELENAEVTGEAGAGMVKVTMTGKHDVKKIDIDDSLMSDDSPEAKEVLEDLIAAAVNATVRKLETERQEKMSELTAGMPLPPGFKLPF